MFLDHRTYTVKPGKLKAFIDHYEKLGLPLQREHLGEPFGYFTTEVGTQDRCAIGNLNRIVKYCRSCLVDEVFRAVAQHLLGSAIEERDRAVDVCRYQGIAGIVQDRRLKRCRCCRALFESRLLAIDGCQREIATNPARQGGIR